MKIRESSMVIPIPTVQMIIRYKVQLGSKHLPQIIDSSHGIDKHETVGSGCCFQLNLSSPPLPPPPCAPPPPTPSAPPSSLFPLFLLLLPPPFSCDYVAPTATST